MKIAIAGAGYVGLSSAMLLSQNHEVVVLDINPVKILLQNKSSKNYQPSTIDSQLAWLASIS